MKIIILCGGYGTRLSSYGSELPKPMIPIGGKPILWHIMRGLDHWGFCDFVLCLGYRSDLIKQYFLHLAAMLEDVTLDFSQSSAPVVSRSLPELKWRIVLAETGVDSMTGHRVKRAGNLIPPEDELFGVTYGDGVSDIDYREVVRFHCNHGKLATVTAVRPPGRFGELALDANGVVAAFNEKPQAEAGWISGGFFVFSRRVLECLSDDPALVLEREPLQNLARAGQLAAYRHEGFWYCLDTPRDYVQLSQFWSHGRAPWVVWE